MTASLRTTRPFFFSLAAIWTALSLSSCRFVDRPSHPVAAYHKPAAVAAIPPMVPVDLKMVHPNEMGVVPILEFHDLVKTERVTGYQYPAAKFRADMEWLYAHRYRPISLSDFVEGHIDVPAGMSPVILTFDDALRGQFHYLPNGQIDPDCAVGILDALHAQHPDWALKGTFFVLTDYDPKLPPPFYQKASAKAKLDYLVKEGFEIGNHTVHHSPGMRHFSDARVQAEFAGAVAGIQRYLPGYVVDMLALPYGVYPKNRSLVISGESGGIHYHNICAMMAGAGPAPSPLSKQFKPYRLPRIIPGSEPLAMTYWLNYLQSHQGERYVSDGDPNTITVKADDKRDLNMPKVKQDHLHLRAYSGTQIIASR